MTGLACAVCYAAKDDASNFAFMVMTAFMTLLPLAALGGLIYLVVRRIRTIESEETRAPSVRPVSAESEGIDLA